MNDLPSIFPIHGMLLVKDLEDPTLGGLFDASEVADDYGFIYGKVVRTGEGFITKAGVIPLATHVGDTIIFLKEQSIPFAVFPNYYYLISETLTSGIVNKDPEMEAVLSEFKGIDIDKIFEETQKTYSDNDELDPLES